jgi:hypothetical protein
VKDDRTKRLNHVRPATLDEIAERPEMAAELPIEAAKLLIARNLVALGALLARLCSEPAAVTPAPDKHPETVRTIGRSGSATSSRHIKPAVEPRADFITLAEAAKHLHLAVHTLYNWITLGKFTKEHGLCQLGGRRRLIHWPTLSEAVRTGKLK